MTIIDKRTGETLRGRATTLEGGHWPDQIESLANDLATDLCNLSDVFTVTLDIRGQLRDARGHRRHPRGIARAARGEGRRVWHAIGPLQWSDVPFTTKIGECPLIDYVTPTAPNAPEPTTTKSRAARARM
jgi:hypothetical protein